MKFKITLLTVLILLILNTGSSFAVSTSSSLDCNLVSCLNLSKDELYVLRFDEKILRYNVADKKSVELQALSNIFNDKQELLIKPVKDTNTSLTIWTKSRAYKFAVIINSFDNIQLDKPPFLPSMQGGIFSFQIDKPPGR